MKWLLTTTGALGESEQMLDAAELGVVLAGLLEKSTSRFEFDQDVEAVCLNDGLRLSGSQLLALSGSAFGG